MKLKFTSKDLVWLVLAFSISACATVSEPPPQHFTVPIAVERNWSVTNVTVNGEQLRFIVDTAAGGTVIDAAVAERLRLPSAGAGQVAGATSGSAVNKVRADRVELGGAVRENLQMVVTNMGQFGGAFAGILGNDVLRHYSYILDTPGQRLDLWTANRPPMAAGANCIANALPQRGEALTGFALVEAQVKLPNASAPQPVIAVIDSGAARTIFNWPAARALGLTPTDPRVTERRPLSGINGNAAGPPSHSFRLEGMTLAEWAVPAAEVRISDFPVFEVLGFAASPAVIIGADLLNRQAFGVTKGAAEFCIGGRVS
jgi:predicted aspartyl protease